MRLGIFIDNRGISSVDCSNLLLGNPGIGGTAYSILLLCQVYKKAYPSVEVVLISTVKGIFPFVDKTIIVPDFSKAIDACVENKVDIFVIRPVINAEPLCDELLNKISEKHVKTVAWAHNFYDAGFAKKIARNPFVVANVFVGKQEYDYYIDHEIIKKSRYIYNMYPIQNKQVRKYSDGVTVTYIGSLVKSKGFHILAKSWKNILKEIPEAQLYVIGSGALYSRNAKLGKYNIADENYEKMFMPYLLDEKKELLPSVHFLGNLGAEKDEYIMKTSVGVINPSGRTETFGISALDFESQAVPVVTIAYVGFLDTVKHDKTGLLYKHTDDISKMIIALLKDKERNEKMGNTGQILSRKFEPDKIIVDWNRLFTDIMSGTECKIQMPDDFMGSQFKWIRVANRRFKNFFKVESFPALISIETKIKQMIKRIRK